MNIKHVSFVPAKWRSSLWTR